MLQLVDDPAAAPLTVLSEREPVESDLSGLLLRITLFPSSADDFIGMLNFPSNLMDKVQANALMESFQRLLHLALQEPNSALDKLALDVLEGTSLKEHPVVPSGVTRALNRQEYMHLGGLSRTKPADLWSPRAMSMLHWHNPDHSAWLSQTNGCWRGWKDATAATYSMSTEWQPWATLLHEVRGTDSNPKF